MSAHALEVLEFERVLERVAQRSASAVARERIRRLRPSTDGARIERELGRVSAAFRFVEDHPDWALGPVPDVRGELPLLDVEGAVLEPVGLHRIGLLLASSRALSRVFSQTGEAYPELASIRDRLADLKDLEERIVRSVDAEGRVADRASKELKRIRDRLRGAQSKIVKKLEAYLGTLPDRFLVSDASVTIREGRYVIPVRREGKGEVGGIVHDESQTGSTLYIEPPVAIEATNELRSLEREEGREVRRVLARLTEEAAGRRNEIAGAFDALVDFDTLHARARTARSWNAVPPELTPPGVGAIELREARHPLLVEAAEGPVVPYDLTLAEGERCLVVSGPNTGGKSVFLKATGLIAALTQSGVVPPVGAGTKLPVFTSFFADIGDEQSIARNLSTFSAHLENLSRIVAEADEGSLVLIDEMGTGTDPSEGAALSRAILEELVSRGATTIVSSHLGELKRLDGEGSRIVNASLQFDSKRMEPTYRLVKGRPGRSFGLAIARRLGFSGHVLDRAETYVEEGAASLEDLLERLEHQEREVQRLLHELDIERARTERLRTDVEDRAQTLREAERTAEDRARSDARQMLLDAREEVERAIADLKRSVGAGDSVDEAARQARGRVEAAARDHREERQRLAQREGPPGADGDGVQEGDRVRIHATGAEGRLVDRRGERGLVEVGALRFEVALDELERVGGSELRPDTDRRTGGWSGPEKGQARLEIDLRGLRVDEMELELSRALDQAVLEDLSQLRIIHGKGTGALRSRVGEMLKRDGRVQGFRMGAPGEGGAGVTVATFSGSST
ncbi:MAG: endonuclease MutS2 [Gemmatimonadota bacterium]|nr:endonuclease MutS2 [Gemmatimonadota bacterium]